MRRVGGPEPHRSLSRNRPARCGCRDGTGSPTGSSRSLRPSRARRSARLACAPSSTTSSPGYASMSVMSIISMSMQTRPDDWRAAPADEDEPAPRHPQVDAVSVAGRDHGDPRGPLRRESCAVAHGLARRGCASPPRPGCAGTAPDEGATSTPAAEARRRRAGGPAAPGRTTTRASRSSAALLAACTTRGRTPREASSALARSNRSRCCSISGCSGMSAVAKCV